MTGNFFDVLGARPALGRLLRADDDVIRMEPNVVQPIVLSHRAWLQWFGGDSAVIGRALHNPYGEPNSTVVGVASAGLDYPVGVDYRAPVGNNGTDIIARLAPGVSADAARAEVLAIAQRVTVGPKGAVAAARVRGFADDMIGSVKPVLIALGIGATILLLAACVNVGNLLLLRASSRAHEIAVRRAIGASDADLLALFVIESTLIAVVSAIGGLFGTVWLTRVLLAVAPPRLPRIDVLALGGAPVVLVIAVSFVTLVLFGVVPGLPSLRGEVVTPLRGTGRTASQASSQHTLRRGLVATQVALALLLVACASLLTRSMSRLESIRLGYQPEHLTFIAVSFDATRYLDATQHVFPLGEQILARMRAVQGVTSVTPVMIPPFIGPNVWRWNFLPDAPSSVGEREVAIPIESTDSAAISALGLSLVRGRQFTAADRDGAEPVVMVSESAARELWPGQDPVGKQLRLKDGKFLPSGDGPRTVVGVVRDLHFREFRESSPTVFFPWRQLTWQGWLAVRTSRDIAQSLPALRDAVGAIGPDVNVSQVQSMDELLASPLAVPRLGAFLLGAFGIVALFLAAVGLYAVVASSARQRTREMGIRLALGATARDVRRRVIGDAMRVVSAGTVVGLVGAVIAGRLMTTLLYDVSPTDPVSLVGAGVALALVGLVAAYVPAVRVARTDPASVLRAEL